MKKAKFTSNHQIILSENEESSTKANVKFIICDFEPNKNNVSLNRETIDDWVSSLVGQPVVGKIATSSSGISDFTSHNAKIVKKVDAQGKEYSSVEFDTSAFGTFKSVAIETIDEKEYIVAEADVWKRYSQAYEVLRSRANTIKTSWEIQVSESHEETINGKIVKVIDKGEFFGHALLGSSVTPAYETSKVLEVASSEFDMELAEAWISDIQNQKDKEENDLPKKQETSALTTRDLHQKVREALNPKGWNSSPCYSVWEIYPEEHKVLAYDIERDSEDDYIVFTYTISEDAVTVGEGTISKLSKIIAEKEPIIQLNSQLEEVSKKLETKENELIEASEKIQSLQASVDTLEPFKIKYEEAESKRIEQETSQKREQLKEFASSSGFITKEELEISEIKTMIDELDEKGIKVLIAERLVASTGSKQKSQAPQGKRNINEDEDALDHKIVMSSFLNKH
ncbi:hypothetical protein H6F38_23135 [Paenibacillus sp. EKM208P]|nr:hypothetical protein H6F38_23135 [Paenibacillus sp. EKM208P]